jgi:hypothetical protein
MAIFYYDVILAVFGVPIALTGAFSIIKHRMHRPKKWSSKFAANGSVILVSDLWSAFALEYSDQWGVSPQGLDAIRSTMHSIDLLIPAPIRVFLPDWFILMLILTIIMAVVLFGP